MGLEKTTSLDKFTATPFRQEIELLHVEHEAQFSALRVRIREIKRFTVFEIDAATAEHWGKALLDWAAKQREGESK